jgi:predicted MarR family transcription regulator
VFRRRTVLGFYPELIDVVHLAQTGKIHMLVEHFALERAGEAYHLLQMARSRDGPSSLPTASLRARSPAG